jgi:hypothetical protein
MTHSLRGRLFIGLTLMIVSTGLLAGIVAFRWAFDEAIEMQDSILTQIGAFALSSRLQKDTPINAGVDPEAQRARSGFCKTACMSSRATRRRGGLCCGPGRTAAGLRLASLPRCATRSPATARFMPFSRSWCWRPA